MRFRDFAAAVIWAIAVGVAVFVYAVPSATAAATLGALVGYLIGVGLEHSRLRLPAGLLACFLLHIVVNLLVYLPANSPLVSSLLGAQRTFVGFECVSWFTQGIFATAFLRFLSGRIPSLVSLEVLTVALLLVSPLAAHRQGFIHRPYFLVDPLWSRNQDPVPVFLTIGAVAAVLLILLAVGRRTKRASILDVGLLLLFISFLYLALPEHRLRELLPEPKGVAGVGKGKKPPPPGSKNKDKDKDKDQSEEQPFDSPPPDDPKPKPVAVVLLRDDYTPPMGAYYFRQSACSQYNGQRLVVDTTGNYDKDIFEHFPVEKMMSKEAPQGRSAQSFQQLDSFVAMIDSHTKPFGLADPLSIEPEDNPDPAKFVRAYSVHSEVLTADYPKLLSLKAGDPKWQQSDWKHYTEAPSDPRYRQLADQVLDQLRPDLRSKPVAQAVALKLYLDKTVYYSLKATHPEGEDPVAHYLFVDPKGKCVHQAHAMAYLLRSIGLPSRIAQGYATNARNRGNGSTILLRDREAHAWPEVYLEGAGWVIMDINPEKGDSSEIEPPDGGLQRMMGEMARKKEKNSVEQDQFKKVSLRDLLRNAAWVGVLSTLFAAGIALCANYLWKFYRRFEPLWCSSERAPAACLRSGLDQLAEVGLSRQFGESRLQFAQRLQLEPLEALTHWHYLMAYSQDRVSLESKSIHKQRESLHQKIAARFPLWRRFLGFWHPWSWWYSR